MPVASKTSLKNIRYRHVKLIMDDTNTTEIQHGFKNKCLLLTNVLNLLGNIYDNCNSRTPNDVKYADSKSDYLMVLHEYLFTKMLKQSAGDNLISWTRKRVSAKKKNRVSCYIRTIQSGFLWTVVWYMDLWMDPYFSSSTSTMWSRSS